MEQLDRRAGAQRPFACRAESARRLDDQERPQPFAARQNAMTHRRQQPFGPRDLARQRRLAKQALEHDFDLGADLLEARQERALVRFISHRDLMPAKRPA